MIAKLKLFLETLAMDKKLHFVAGLLVATIVAVFCRAQEFSIVMTGAFGIAAAIAAGYAKEWWDARRGGVFDNQDWLYTGVGGVVAGILVPLAMKLTEITGTAAMVAP